MDNKLSLVTLEAKDMRKGTVFISGDDIYCVTDTRDQGLSKAVYAMTPNPNSADGWFTRNNYIGLEAMKEKVCEVVSSEVVKPGDTVISPSAEIMLVQSAIKGKDTRGLYCYNVDTEECKWLYDPYVLRVKIVTEDIKTVTMAAKDMQVGMLFVDSESLYCVMAVQKEDYNVFVTACTNTPCYIEVRLTRPVYCVVEALQDRKCSIVSSDDVAIGDILVLNDTATVVVTNIQDSEDGRTLVCEDVNTGQLIKVNNQHVILLSNKASLKSLILTNVAWHLYKRGEETGFTIADKISKLELFNQLKSCACKPPRAEGFDELVLSYTISTTGKEVNIPLMNMTSDVQDEWFSFGAHDFVVLHSVVSDTAHTSLYNDARLTAEKKGKTLSQKEYVSNLNGYSVDKKSCEQPGMLTNIQWKYYTGSNVSAERLIAEKMLRSEFIDKLKQTIGRPPAPMGFDELVLCYTVGDTGKEVTISVVNMTSDIHAEWYSFEVNEPVIIQSVIDDVDHATAYNDEKLTVAMQGKLLYQEEYVSRVKADKDNFSKLRSACDKNRPVVEAYARKFGVPKYLRTLPESAMSVGTVFEEDGKLYCVIEVHPHGDNAGVRALSPDNAVEYYFSMEEYHVVDRFGRKPCSIMDLKDVREGFLFMQRAGELLLAIETGADSSGYYIIAHNLFTQVQVTIRAPRVVATDPSVKDYRESFANLQLLRSVRLVYSHGNVPVKTQTVAIAIFKRELFDMIEAGELQRDTTVDCSLVRLEYTATETGESVSITLHNSTSPYVHNMSDKIVIESIVDDLDHVAKYDNLYATHRISPDDYLGRFHRSATWKNLVWSRGRTVLPQQ